MVRGSVKKMCGALSPQMNCGCCDAVMLGCDLEEHPGNPVHAETRREYADGLNGPLVTIRVIWEVVK